MKTKLFFAAILLTITGYAFASSDSSELTTDLRNFNTFSGLIVNTPANDLISRRNKFNPDRRGEEHCKRDFNKIENGSLIIDGNNNHAVTIT
ncbi:MAG: hypothetical protein IPF75_04755 [Bacteroidetes bacterium]|nr:hypothetical protein [Bacteroidota bacterium]